VSDVLPIQDNGIRNPGTQEELLASVYPLNIKGSCCEVEEEPVLTVDGAEVRTDDNEINISEAFAGFEFDHDEIFHEHVDAKKADLSTVIQHGNSEVSRKRDIAAS
jgi:hypothetical protein